MHGKSKRGARAAALVTLALVGSSGAVFADRASLYGASVAGRQRHRVVSHVSDRYHHVGYGLTLGGAYLGIGGYSNGLYLGVGGYGGGLYLGLGGHSGGVILGVGGHGGVPYSFFLPDGYATGAVSAPVYSSTTYPGASVAPLPLVSSSGYYSVQPMTPLAVVPGAASAGDSLLAERVNGGILRLTCREDVSRVREVTLFLTDERRTVLAQQTVRAAPFTALFDTLPGTAYVGATVHHRDGVESTTVMPAPRR